MASWRMIGERWPRGACAFAIGAALLGAVLSYEPNQLDHDDAGPYLLPETFVGSWEERGFEVDPRAREGPARRAAKADAD